mgnify:CR=1 FL=1
MSTSRNVIRIPNLDPLEERLSEEVKGVNIIDEVSIDRELRDKLQKAFNYHLLGESRSLKGLLRSYTTCFAVHLVAEGIYGYESGNYWGGTPLKKHGSQNDIQEGGRFFETFVETCGLETFPDRPFRYVSLILLHSSLPNDVLSSFFELALYPAVHDPGWQNFGSRELIQRWPERPPSNRLPKIAHTFFQNGGEVAVDFAARCLEMAEQTARSGEVPSPEKVRLPKRIPEAYADWLDSRQEEPGQQPKKTRKRRSRKRRASIDPPQIWLDPWQDQVMVDLPEQKFPASRKSRDALEWKVEAKSRAEVTTTQVDAHIYKSRDEWKSEPESAPLVAPARSYNISLTGLTSSHSWTFSALSPESQLLVFDGDTQEMIESPQGLPSRPLWLMHPHGEELSLAGGKKVHAEQRLHGPWEDFAVACWDLSSADSVTVGDKTWPVVSQGQGLQPRLVGGEQLQIGGNRDKYYTQLPEIRVPVPPGRKAQEEVKDWEWQIAAEGEAPTTCEIDPARTEVALEDHAITLLLSQVIGHIGNYEVGVRGPLGRSASFTVSHVGDCSVHLPTGPRLPKKDGSYPPERVILGTPPGVQLSCERDDVEIESSGGEGHEVVFGETCTQANIEIRSSLKDSSLEDSSQEDSSHKDSSQENSMGEESSVELPLVAPGLQWKVRGKEWNQSWSTRPLRLAMDKIEQSSEAVLLARSKPSSGGANVQGELRVEEGHDPQEGQGPEERRDSIQSISSKSRAAGRLQFDLLEVLDLLRHTDRSLQLRLALGEGRSAAAVRLEASLEVEEMSLIADRSGDVWDLMVTWETAGNPVRNRRLRLWSVGRPWESPRTFEIPDDARGEARFRREVSELPPGPYIAALDLVDPWQEDFPERPSEEDSNTELVRVGSASARLKRLWETGSSLEGSLEQAFLAGSVSDANRHLREAPEILAKSDVSTLLRALWWIGSSGSLVNQISDKQNVVLRWIRRKVLDHPGELVASFANQELRAASKSRLQRFVVTLGAPQALVPDEDWARDTLDTAWQTWGPLGWMLEARSILDGKSRSVRHARNAMGVGELIESNGKEPTSDRTADSRAADSRAAANLDQPSWKQLDKRTDVFGGRPQKKLLSLPAPILREQQHHLNATLRGHFDDERSWQAVNFDWLLSYKEDAHSPPQGLPVLEKFRGTLRSGVQQILENERVTKPVAKAVLDRHDPHPDAVLANVPFCSGATALLQRAYATWGISLPFVDPEDLVRCGVAAFDVAQRLYERDLCLMSIAIEQEKGST